MPKYQIYLTNLRKTPYKLSTDSSDKVNIKAGIYSGRNLAYINTDIELYLNHTGSWTKYQTKSTNSKGFAYFNYSLDSISDINNCLVRAKCTINGTEFTSNLDRLNFINFPGIDCSGMSTQGAILNGPYRVTESSDGNYLYVASKVSDAIEIIDIGVCGTKSNPLHKGSLSNGDGGAKLDSPHSIVESLDENYLYVASNSSNAIEIIDIGVDGTRANPVHEGSFSHDPSTHPLYMPKCVAESSDGNYLYVGAIGYVVILDIGDNGTKATPVEKGRINDGDGGAEIEHPWCIAESSDGNYLYVASSNSNAIEIIDIGVDGSKTNPVHEGNISNGGDVKLEAPYWVTESSDGDYLYVASAVSDAIEIIDIGVDGSKTNPVHEGSISNGGDVKLDTPRCVAESSDGNYLYVASSGSDAIEIIDIGVDGTKSNPEHEGSISYVFGEDTKLQAPFHVAESSDGNYLYVASAISDAIEIIDIGVDGSKTNPVHEGYIEDCP